jgi:EmrB/QacA subfamily drug resistance transporter
MPTTQVDVHVDPPAPGPVHSTQPTHRWWALVVIGLAQLMVVLDNTIVNIALPSAQQALHFTSGDRQWIVTAYTLAFGSLLLLGGRLADLVGRKTTFMIGMFGFAVASAVGGAATSFTILVTARTIQGAFGALLAPAALSLLTTTFTEARERARAFGVYGAIVGSGAAIGLLLGGLLTQYASWRWTLYVNDFIAVIGLVGAAVFLRRSVPAGRPRLDVPGAVLVSAGLFCLVYGFANAETHSWDSPMVWGFLTTAVVLLLAFFWWQTRAKSPLLPLRVLADRDRGAALATVLIVSAVTFGVFLFLSYYLQGTLHFSPLRSGLAFLPLVGALMLTAQLATNWLAPRFGPKVVVPVGLLLAATGAVGLTGLGLHSTYAAHLLAPLLLIGAGMGLSIPTAISRVTIGVATNDQGVASATANSTQQIGGSISIALLNTLAVSAATHYAQSHPTDPHVAANAAVHSYATAYGWSAGGVVLGALIAAILFRPKGSNRPAANGAAVIHGRVLDGAGAPVAHAAVTLLDPAGFRLDRATTHEDGSYAVHTVERGRLGLIGSAPGHQPQIATLAVDGEPVSYDPVLLAGPGGLVGTVRGPDGSAVAGARVVVTDQWGEVVGSATSGTGGGYRIDDLVPDTVTVTVTAAGRHPVSDTVTVDGTDLPGLVDVNGKSHNRFDLVLSPERTVSG